MCALPGAALGEHAGVCFVCPLEPPAPTWPVVEKDQGAGLPAHGRGYMMQVFAVHVLWDLSLACGGEDQGMGLCARGLHCPGCACKDSALHSLQSLLRPSAWSRAGQHHQQDLTPSPGRCCILSQPTDPQTGQQRWQATLATHSLSYGSNNCTL